LLKNRTFNQELMRTYSMWAVPCLHLLFVTFTLLKWQAAAGVCFLTSLGLIFPLIMFSKDWKEAVSSLTIIALPICAITFGVLVLALGVGCWASGSLQPLWDHGFMSVSVTSFTFMVLVAGTLPFATIAMALKIIISGRSFLNPK
jgi:hypothetical protein